VTSVRLFVLLTVCFLVLFFDISLVEAMGTIRACSYGFSACRTLTCAGNGLLTVGPAGSGATYTMIQEAIKWATGGDTIRVWAGTYTENVVVWKSVNIQGAGPSNTIVVAANTSQPVFGVSANYVNLTGFTITGALNHSAVVLSYANYTRISANNLVGNEHGIMLGFSYNSSISENLISRNTRGGISSLGSSVSVSGNDITGNGDGISLDLSCNSSISGNNITGNKIGINLFLSEDNTISGNNVTGNSGVGIDVSFSSDNLIYDNCFSNSVNAKSVNFVENPRNDWNVTKRLGKNILGGPYLGGNYWSDYTGDDLDGDGLGDTSLPYDSDGYIEKGGDWLPLTLKFALIIQTPIPESPIEVDGKSLVPDADGKIQVFLSPGSHVLKVTPAFLDSPGSRKIFTQWDDKESSNPRLLYVNQTLTLRAEYTTQYRLMMDANFGTTNPPVGEQWYDAGSIIEISASPPEIAVDQGSERYIWLGWTGTGNGSYTHGNNPFSITIYGPINQTAVWRHEYYLTVTSPHGSPVPTTGWFENGSLIYASVNSPVLEQTGVTRYACVGWNGTGSVPQFGTTQSTTFTISRPSNITWNWKTQYILTVRTEPTGLNPLPISSPSGPWLDSGTLVTCIGQRIDGYAFDHWTAEGANWDRGVDTITLVIDKACEVIAHYVRVKPWWETLSEPGIISAVATIAGLAISTITIGFAGVRTRRRRSVTNLLLKEAQKIFSTRRTNPRKCEEELIALKNKVLEMLTNGKITEQIHGIVDKRISEYMEDLLKQRSQKGAS